MKYLLGLCLFPFLISNCIPASTALSAKGEPAVHPEFADVPVPEGFEFLRGLSDKHEWEWSAKKIRFGQLVYRGTASVAGTQDFYKRRMVASDAGWRETGSSSAPDVLLSFEKGSGENRESCQVRITREDTFTIVRISLEPIGSK